MSYRTERVALVTTAVLALALVIISLAKVSSLSLTITCLMSIFSIVLTVFLVLIYLRCRRMRQQRRVLAMISDQLTQERDLGESLDNTSHALIELLPLANKCVIHLFDGQNQMLFPRYSSVPNGHHSPGIAPGVGIAGAALNDGQLHIVPDVRRDPTFVAMESDRGLRSLMVMPLKFEGQILGTVSVNSSIPDVFGRVDGELLRIVAAQISAACHQSSLGRVAEQETRYLDAIIQNATDGIIILDATGHIRRYSPAVAHILGADVRHIVGQRVSADSDLEVIRLLAEILGDGLAGGEPSAREVTISRPIHAVLEIRVGPAPSSVLGDRVVIIQDVTAHEDKLATQVQLAASTAREVAAAAEQIRSYTTLLESYHQPGGPESQWLTRLRERGMFLERLARGLAYTHAIEAGTLSASPKPSSLIGVLQEVIEDLAPTLAERQVHLVKDYPANLPPATIAPELVGDVVYNLLLGVALRMPPGSEVTLRTTTTMWELLFRVSADGQPYSQAEREALFADRYRPDDSEGALPLYICRRLVEALGGHLWLDDGASRPISLQAILPIGDPASVQE